MVFSIGSSDADGDSAMRRSGWTPVEMYLMRWDLFSDEYPVNPRLFDSSIRSLRFIPWKFISILHFRWWPDSVACLDFRLIYCVFSLLMGK